MMKVERASLSKSELAGSPGKGPWHDVVSIMGFEMNGNNVSNGVTEVG